MLLHLRPILQFDLQHSQPKFNSGIAILVVGSFAKFSNVSADNGFVKIKVWILCALTPPTVPIEHHILYTRVTPKGAFKSKVIKS